MTKAELEVENFNLKIPVGTKVTVWSMVKEGPGETGEVLSPAVLNGKGRSAYGTVFIRRAGKGSSTFSISHVEPLRQ